MSGGCKSDLLPGTPDPGFSPENRILHLWRPEQSRAESVRSLGQSKSGTRL